MNPDADPFITDYVFFTLPFPFACPLVPPLDFAAEFPVMMYPTGQANRLPRHWPASSEVRYSTKAMTVPIFVSKTREESDEEKLTDVSSESSKKMPPPMQLKHKRPWHADRPLYRCELGAVYRVNIPDYEAGDKYHFADISKILK
jgi:hypothetical protein